MSWTTVKGHHPVGPVMRDAHDKPLQKCSCGKWYDWRHIDDCVED